jgi:hypothetical protein
MGVFLLPKINGFDDDSMDCPIVTIENDDRFVDLHGNKRYLKHYQNNYLKCVLA